MGWRPVKKSLTPYEQRLLRRGAERIAAYRAQQAADAAVEWLNPSEVIREAVFVLLGKNWHHASDEEIAQIKRWVRRWLQINAVPMRGCMVDAAALRAVLARERAPANPGTEGPVSPQTKTDAFRRWAQKTYPKGIPPGTGAKTLRNGFEAAGTVKISERQVRRALRRK
jgi:hypothetical protein